MVTFDDLSLLVSIIKVLMSVWTFESLTNLSRPASCPPEPLERIKPLRAGRSGPQKFDRNRDRKLDLLSTSWSGDFYHGLLRVHTLYVCCCYILNFSRIKILLSRFSSTQ